MAKEYIEREALLTRLQKVVVTGDVIGMGIQIGTDNAISYIEEAPAADVVEVRHGYWIPSPDGINPIRCSECNMPAPFATGENEFGDFEICRYPSSYCHECGAKMDGEGRTENEL